MRLRMPAVSVLTLLLLTGCAASGARLAEQPPPQAIPADLRTCFDKLVPVPQQASMTVADVLELVGKLKRSELEKSQCGKRLIKFYDANAR
jgi:hypothetical protein